VQFDVAASRRDPLGRREVDEVADAVHVDDDRAVGA
jgi:hypothetical protein